MKVFFFFIRLTLFKPNVPKCTCKVSFVEVTVDLQGPILFNLILKPNQWLLLYNLHFPKKIIKNLKQIMSTAEKQDKNLRFSKNCFLLFFFPSNNYQYMILITSINYLLILVIITALCAYWCGEPWSWWWLITKRYNYTCLISHTYATLIVPRCVTNDWLLLAYV